jgi:hypothetical protein
VYGPGADGIHVEYLYRSPGVASELLLARSGAVSNRGGNYFQLDFAEPFAAFEADSVKAGDGTADALATGRPLQGGALQSAGRSTGLELQVKGGEGCERRVGMCRFIGSCPVPCSEGGALLHLPLR